MKLTSHPLFEKLRIFAPGPTPVPEEVLAILGKAPVHHRTPEFAATWERVWKNLEYLYQTKQPCYVLSSSGTGAMEATVTSCLSTGDEVLVLNAGKFGERWTSIAKAFGLKVHEVVTPWGDAINPDEVKKALTTHPAVRAVLFQAVETSTGVLHPVREIAKTVHDNSSALIFVDAITALGVCELPMDAWGLDAVISGSQKALMLPPGISTIAFSERARKARERATIPSFYFDLKNDDKSRKLGQTAWTPAVGLIAGLDLILQRFKEAGLEAVFKHHLRLAEGTRRGLQASGFELLAKHAPAPSITAVMLPKGCDKGEALIEYVRARFGVTIAEGQDHLKGKMIRIGHLGYFDELDMITVLSAVEMAAQHVGIPVNFGAGPAAAGRYFLEGSL
ncbi:alanine--glyoxylate aminotransferase family protein [bacterium]|nr:alanine--glyoxylate aminotransferase family protein [bacterium]